MPESGDDVSRVQVSLPHGFNVLIQCATVGKDGQVGSYKRKEQTIQLEPTPRAVAPDFMLHLGSRQPQRLFTLQLET